ncbi:MAG: hypothetical protein EZS28_034729 [Streblomastix strix]|uniref:Transmembrane protein n=1 Tax=Streblomastix strix TaxID=222440 RepID=A0A5J4UHW8_9EUKA|nr:MAG: hypothetical protein EZS28_034729 [Streblomastix strix]
MCCCNVINLADYDEVYVSYNYDIPYKDFDCKDVWDNYYIGDGCANGIIYGDYKLIQELYYLIIIVIVIIIVVVKVKQFIQQMEIQYVMVEVQEIRSDILYDGEVLLIEYCGVCDDEGEDDYYQEDYYYYEEGEDQTQIDGGGFGVILYYFSLSMASLIPFFIDV